MAGEFSLLDNGANYSAVSGLLSLNPDSSTELYWNGTAFVAFSALTNAQAFTMSGGAIIAGYKETNANSSWSGKWLFDIPAAVTAITPFAPNRWCLHCYGSNPPVAGTGNTIGLSYAGSTEVMDALGLLNLSLNLGALPSEVYLCSQQLVLYNTIAGMYTALSLSQGTEAGSIATTPQVFQNISGRDCMFYPAGGVRDPARCATNNAIWIAFADLHQTSNVYVYKTTPGVLNPQHVITLNSGHGAMGNIHWVQDASGNTWLVTPDQSNAGASSYAAIWKLPALTADATVQANWTYTRLNNSPIASGDNAYIWYDGSSGGGLYWAWGGSGLVGGTKHIYSNTTLANTGWTDHGLMGGVPVSGSTGFLLAFLSQPIILADGTMRWYSTFNGNGGGSIYTNGILPCYIDAAPTGAGGWRTQAVANTPGNTVWFGTQALAINGTSGGDGAVIFPCVDRITDSNAIANLLSPTNLAAMAQSKLDSTRNPAPSATDWFQDAPMLTNAMPSNLIQCAGSTVDENANLLKVNTLQLAGDGINPGSHPSQMLDILSSLYYNSPLGLAYQLGIPFFLTVPAGSLYLGYDHGGIYGASGIDVANSAPNYYRVDDARFGVIFDDETEFYTLFGPAGETPLNNQTNTSPVGPYSNGVVTITAADYTFTLLPSPSTGNEITLQSLLQYVSGNSGPQQFTQAALAEGAGSAATIWNYGNRTLTGGNTTVIVTSPMLPNMDLQIVPGDSYDTATGQPIIFTDNGTWPNLSGFEVICAVSPLSDPITPIFQFPCTPTTGPPQTVPDIFTATNTAKLVPGNAYVYQIRAKSGSDVRTLVGGQITALGAINLTF